MSNRKTFWIVLISIVGVLAILAGGYALYRWGYARGASSEMVEFMSDRFSGEHDGFHMHEFGEQMMPWGRQTGMHGIGFRGVSMPHLWRGGGFIGLLLGGGVLALAVYGVISLVRTSKSSDE
jgi:hypothetical protein